jgi:8-amino-3,8-dideoxy-alpha-D-manno-octulosonate transaminase
VKKRSNSSDGFPWSHPANEFGKSISYEKGTLPKCDELAERSALLAIASTLSDKDVDDIIAAFKKVAAQVLR